MSAPGVQKDMGNHRSEERANTIFWIVEESLVENQSIRLICIAISNTIIIVSQKKKAKKDIDIRNRIDVYTINILSKD